MMYNGNQCTMKEINKAWVKYQADCKLYDKKYGKYSKRVRDDEKTLKRIAKIKIPYLN